MKLIDYAHKKIMFKQSDKVVCIGKTTSSEELKIAVIKSGTKNIEMIPSINEYAAKFKDRQEMINSLMGYDYHLVFGRISKDSIEAYEKLAGKRDVSAKPSIEPWDKSIVNTGNIRFRDMNTGTLFKIADGKVLRGYTFYIIPNLYEKLTKKY